jgi:DNA-binding LacI/PurR family transcriptional regulator
MSATGAVDSSHRSSSSGWVKGPYIRAVDVASAAGVSTSVVSLVVNGKDGGRVSPATRRRVMEAVQRLGYKVDAGARALATGRRRAIALIIPDVRDPFFGQVAMGVARALGGRYQLVLVVAGASGDGVPDLDDVLALRVDGMLVDSTAISVLEPARPPYPVVVLDAPGWDDGTPSVEFNIRAGARELVEHLVGLGHRVFGYIDWNRTSATFEVRRDASIARLGQLLGPAGSLHLIRASVSIDDGRGAFLRAWKGWRDAGVTAVICATDLQAYGVLEAARESGIGVPGDISVAAFNDLELSRVVVPSLTSVALPAFELGRSSADLLRRIVEGRPARLHRQIGARVMVRGSTGAVTGRP